MEGGSENEQVIQIEGSDQKLPIEDLQRLGNALSRAHGNSQAGTDSLVTVFCPKASNKLLQNEVVLVDSPVSLIHTIPMIQLIYCRALIFHPNMIAGLINIVWMLMFLY